jgi:hypothetical protein
MAAGGRKGQVLLASVLMVLFVPYTSGFGHSLLPLFGFRKGYTNLNHGRRVRARLRACNGHSNLNYGSYGSVPLSVTANQSAWSALCEQVCIRAPACVCVRIKLHVRTRVWVVCAGTRRLVPGVYQQSGERLRLPGQSARVARHVHQRLVQRHGVHRQRQRGRNMQTNPISMEAGMCSPPPDQGRSRQRTP